jgi:4-amino-4-deoxy-L-arabinose transferase-like glycosyltransferase
MTAIGMEEGRDQIVRQALASPGFLWAAWVLAAALRLGVVFGVGLDQTSDFAWYLDRARELALGQGYHINGVPTAYWPIGYPAFLGLAFHLFGGEVLVGQLANLALSLGLLAAVRRLVLDMGGDRAAANLAVLLLAIYPNQVAYTALLSSEPLFALLLTVGILAMFRGTWQGWTAAGLLFGLAVLTKPQALPIPALLLAVALVRRPLPWRTALTAGAIVYLAIGAVLTPWQLRNQALFGEFVFVSNNGGGNLLIGANPAATGGWMKPEITWSGPAAAITATGELERAKQARRQAIAWIKANPVAFLTGFPAKVKAQFAADGEAGWGFADGLHDRSPAALETLYALRLVNQAFYILLWIAAVLGLYRLVGAAAAVPRIAWAGLVVIACFSGLALVFFGAPRFHYPMMPFVVAYGAIGLTSAFSRGAFSRSGPPLRAPWREAR